LTIVTSAADNVGAIAARTVPGDDFTAASWFWKFVSPANANVTACPLPVTGRCVVDGDFDDDDSDDEASVPEAPLDEACSGDRVLDVAPRASTELPSVPAQAVTVAETSASVAAMSIAARRPNGVDLRSLADPRQT
jgi:hypothetical protein